MTHKIHLLFHGILHLGNKMTEILAGANIRKSNIEGCNAVTVTTETRSHNLRTTSRARLRLGHYASLVMIQENVVAESLVSPTCNPHITGSSPSPDGYCVVAFRKLLYSPL